MKPIPKLNQGAVRPVRWLALGIVPVSYTHLDVYKRQVRSAQRSRRSTRGLRLQSLAESQFPVHWFTTRLALSRPRRTSLPARLAQLPIASASRWNEPAARLASLWNWLTGSLERTGGGAGFRLDAGGTKGVTGAAGRTGSAVGIGSDRLTSLSGGGAWGRDSS